MDIDHDYWEKNTAIQQFVLRLRQANSMGVVKNDAFLADEPMYFYCKYCGLICDILPENYLFPPHRICSQCLGLSQSGWMEDAIMAAEDYFCYE